MIVEELLTLPPWVEYEGVHFELQVFNNGGNEVRIGYPISHVSADSPHKGDYDVNDGWFNKVADQDNPPFQGFLVLFENIETDVDLIYAMRSLWYWLQEKGFIAPKVKGL